MVSAHLRIDEFTNIQIDLFLLTDKSCVEIIKAEMSGRVIPPSYCQLSVSVSMVLAPAGC